MRDHDKIIVVPDVFTPEECEALKAEFSQVPLEHGQIFRKVDGAHRQMVDTEARNAMQYKIPTPPSTEFADLRERMYKLGREVNAEHFDFDLEGFPYDRMIYVRYEQGGFFAPHEDARGDAEIGFKKLAMSLQLSADSEFTAGELFISPHGEQPKGQGSVVIFPVYLKHWVAAVNGTREVVINWCCSGRPFR